MSYLCRWGTVWPSQRLVSRRSPWVHPAPILVGRRKLLGRPRRETRPPRVAVVRLPWVLCRVLLHHILHLECISVHLILQIAREDPWICFKSEEQILSITGQNLLFDKQIWFSCTIGGLIIAGEHILYPWEYDLYHQFHSISITYLFRFCNKLHQDSMFLKTNLKNKRSQSQAWTKMNRLS